MIMHKPWTKLISRILTFSVITIIGLAFFIGCAPKNLPVYYPNIIEKQPQKHPKPMWGYPGLSVLKNADNSRGLSGIAKTGEIPASYMKFMQDVEPPFLVSMNLLADGSLVCISPLEMKREYQKFVFAKYCSEVFTLVRIILLDSNKGKEIWSRVIPAKGVYEVKEINSTILFQSKYFDIEGEFVEGQLIALRKKTGKILWQRKFNKPFLYFSIAAKHNLVFFSAETEGGSGNKRTIEGVHLPTGKTNLKFSVTEPDDDKSKKNTWPIQFSDGIMFFENGIAFYELPRGKIKWKRKDFHLKGSSQPVEMGRRVYMQSTDGIVALDVGSGKTLWTNDVIKEKVTKIMHTGNYLCVTDSEKGWFSDMHTLSLLNATNGTIIWKYETDSILGNIVESREAVIFTTKDRLIALDKKKGEELYRIKLPWDDEFSYHSVSLRNQAIIVKNEWNVAKWNTKKGNLIFHHQFEPLCPIMTTQERMLEQKKLGRPVSGMTTTAFTYNSSMNKAWYTSKFNQSMAMYRQTGDSLHLNNAYGYYGMTRHAIGQERIMAGIQTSGAMIQATMSAGMAILQARVQTANSMVYPSIDATLQNVRAFENDEYIARLVGVQEGSQRFSAVEVLKLSSGKVTRAFLSPYQMPIDLKTIGSSVMTATELHGYLPVSIFQHHSFLTLVDFQKKRIFHYGPGLNTDEYVTYGNKGFIRGRLWAFPLNLPI
jgi:outer membrane protein assembly factor BamB